MTAEALLPVGKNCDCGHPLVWHHGQQWCAVYGTHTTQHNHGIICICPRCVTRRAA